MKIESGSGNGSMAWVNASHELLVRARITSDTVAAARNEAALFAVTTEFLSLSNTAIYSGMLYVKNTSQTRSMYLDTVYISGDQNAKWRFYFDSSTGTLISGAVAASSNNTNLKSGNELIADYYKGADGATITDGRLVAVSTTIGWSNAAFPLGGGIILGPGNSFAVGCRPSAAGEFGVSLVAAQSEKNGD